MAVKGFRIMMKSTILSPYAIQGQRTATAVQQEVSLQEFEETYYLGSGILCSKQGTLPPSGEKIFQEEQKEIKQKVSGVAEETKGGSSCGVWKQVRLLRGQKHRVPLHGSRLWRRSKAFQTDWRPRQVLLLVEDARIPKKEVSNPLSQLQFFYRPSRILSTRESLMAKRIKVHEEVLEWL